MACAWHVHDLARTTASQKRRQHAANRLINTFRGHVVRSRYRRARAALLSWRSRELVQVQHALVSWLRRHVTTHAKHATHATHMP